LSSSLKRWLSRPCADKSNLYLAATGFQALISLCFVTSYTVLTIDPGEPFYYRNNSDGLRIYAYPLIINPDPATTELYLGE
jgi:hypothetical protein